MEKRSIIDTDIHPLLDPELIEGYLPQPWRDRFKSGNLGSHTISYWNPNDVRRRDAVTPDGARIESSAETLGKYFLDEYSIEYGILNTDHLAFALTPEPDYASALASAINNVLVECWIPKDERIKTSIVVSPTDPHLAAQEIHRMAERPGVVQVLMPSGAMFPYGHRYYHPIYEAACDHDLPVAIHPGTEGVGISSPGNPSGYPGSYFEWHTGLVSNYVSHLVSLIAEGVFVKYPSLKFALLEGGVSWLPAIMWRMDKNWKGLRRTVPWLDRLPSEYIAEHIMLTTQPIEEPQNSKHLEQILSMFDAKSMLMFSTDFPHWDGDTPDFAAQKLPIEIRPQVMSENARKLYRL